MLNLENLEQFTKYSQTGMENVFREYCQHLFLSYLYQEAGSERLLFKGGTAMRIILRSPRFSEDLDFTGLNISAHEVEDLFTGALANIEKSGIDVEIKKGKPTSGGYLAIAVFHVYGLRTPVQLEISLRKGRGKKGVRALIESEYLPSYTLVHSPLNDLILGKLQALEARSKPRDFYDYYFLLSGNYPLARNNQTLLMVKKLLNSSRINFHSELRKFLPAGQARQLKSFKKILLDKISQFLI